MKPWAAGGTVLALVGLVGGGPVRAQQRPAPATPPAAGQQDTRPGIAILDFDIGATIGQDPEDYQALRRGLSAMTISELAASPAVRVVERAQLQQILQEQDLGRQERVDPNTAARIGRIVGARYMVTGTLYDVRGDFRIDARLIDSETSVILRTQRVPGRLENIFDLVTRLAQQLMRDANLPPLERRAMEERERQRPPQGQPTQQAALAYSRAVLYADRGDADRAIEQYRRALAVFPNYTQARADCNRLQQGACG